MWKEWKSDGLENWQAEGGNQRPGGTDVTSPRAYNIPHNAMMGSITGHTGTETQHMPGALNGWGDFEMQDSRSPTWGGLLCGKSVRPHYCCLCDQRPRPHWWSLCLTEFQQGKWAGSWSTSGLKGTAVSPSTSAASGQQTATSRRDPR